MPDSNPVHFQSHFDGIEGDAICIFGPTACGKTDLACRLYDSADRYDIISVDSALVYKDMNIGTAKPTKAELARYPHALVDIIEPTTSYSVADFVADAKRLMRQSQQAGRVPVLVGGTMLYFKALFSGMDNLPKADAVLRRQLEDKRQALGIAALHAELTEVDAVTAARLKPTDTQRILRALEVYKLTGKPLSALQTKTQLKPPKHWRLIAIEPDRAWLHARIEKRLSMMWQAGFLDEVRYLIDKYNLTTNTPAMRAVGYRQVLEYLVSSEHPPKSEQAMRDKVLYATRQLAKRQYTWLRKFNQLYQVSFYHCATKPLDDFI